LIARQCVTRLGRHLQQKYAEKKDSWRSFATFCFYIDYYAMEVIDQVLGKVRQAKRLDIRVFNIFCAMGLLELGV
jgi:hypothetical protein